MSITKTKVVTDKNGNKKYTYADLAAVNEYLEKIGWKYYQYIDRLEGDDYIMTVPIDKDGNLHEARRGVRIVDATLIGINNPAQEQGSAISYARRYSLLMAFGLSTDDDDAQSLTIPEDKKASEYQIKILTNVYQGENMEKLLAANNLTDLHDMTMAKASELIKKIQEKAR